MDSPLLKPDPDLLSAVKADYQLLSTPGNLGFYRRCSVVEVFLIVKKTQEILPVYTLAVFEEATLEASAPSYVGRPFPVGEDHALGIRSYELTMDAAEAVFLELLGTNTWTAHNKGERGANPVRPIRRQFVPSNSTCRVNTILKNNFFGGSHLIEFFDESKTQLAFLTETDDRRLFDQVNQIVHERITLQLQTNPDRLGSVIFQFPITIVNVRSLMEEKGTRYRLHFAWHPQIGPKGKDCTIISRATLDKTLIQQALYPYNRQAEQLFPITAIDNEAVIDVIDTFTGLLLYHYPHGSAMAVALMFVFNDPTPRVFHIGGEVHKVLIKQVGTPNFPAADYKDLIKGSSYSIEKQELTGRLDFKQYMPGMEQAALKDLRHLIEKYDGQGVYLWDPYLRAADVLRTLCYSPTARVPLRAICSLVKTKRRDDLNEDVQLIHQLIEIQRSILSFPQNHLSALDLEFRAHHSGHGYGFHDRFVLFPGFRKQPPRVYSLGTSVNAMGKSHHILQLVAYPQLIIDAFNDLWDQLQEPDCLIWKSQL